MKEVSETYLKNRQKVLDLTNQDINLSLENDEQVYIAVFDVPVDSGIVGLHTQTLALVFGLHTPIYSGIGEASTDLEQDKEVMHAMQSVLVSSHQALDGMKKVNDVSYYESDYIRVYFKTRSGIFFKELNEDTKIDQFLKMLMYHVYQTISRKFGTSDKETNMKPIISKTPDVPELSKEEVAFLTEVAFGQLISPQACDALFVFGGTHAGHWEKAIEAYQLGLVKQIIVTGGISPTGTPNLDWTHGKETTEAEVIVEHLLEAGIPKESIVYENRSTNTLENVLFAKEVFDFTTIQSLLFVCKSHVAGRQWRTLAQHLPNHLKFIPFTFDAAYEGISLSRDNWMDTEMGRSRVWGEYLRMIHYGKKGDILALDLDIDKEQS